MSRQRQHDLRHDGHSRQVTWSPRTSNVHMVFFGTLAVHHSSVSYEYNVARFTFAGLPRLL